MDRSDIIRVAKYSVTAGSEIAILALEKYRKSHYGSYTGSSQLSILTDASLGAVLGSSIATVTATMSGADDHVTENLETVIAATGAMALVTKAAEVIVTKVKSKKRFQNNFESYLDQLQRFIRHHGDQRGWSPERIQAAIEAWSVNFTEVYHSPHAQYTEYTLTTDDLDHWANAMDALSPLMEDDDPPSIDEEDLTVSEDEDEDE